ncbi:hypothetical protein MBH78_20360 [Oceanimonas sp. NS1]|nr:hypothetical protein [Oceanimonas sp. NS1]
MFSHVTTLARTRGGFRLLASTRNADELATMARFARHLWPPQPAPLPAGWRSGREPGRHHSANRPSSWPPPLARAGSGC